MSSNLQIFSDVAGTLTSAEHNPNHPEINTFTGNKATRIQVGSVSISATNSTSQISFQCKGDQCAETFQDPNIALERGIGLALVLHAFEKNEITFDGFSDDKIIGKIQGKRLAVNCNPQFNLAKATMFRVEATNLDGDAAACPPIRCAPDYFDIMADTLSTAIPAGKESILTPSTPAPIQPLAELEQKINKELNDNGKCKISEEGFDVVGALSWENKNGKAVFTYKSDGIDSHEDCKVQAHKNSSEGAITIFTSEAFGKARAILRNHINAFQIEQSEKVEI